MYEKRYQQVETVPTTSLLMIPLLDALPLASINFYAQAQYSTIFFFFLFFVAKSGMEGEDIYREEPAHEEWKRKLVATGMGIIFFFYL
jgi:hypothetical protein